MTVSRLSPSDIAERDKDIKAWVYLDTHAYASDKAGGKFHGMHFGVKDVLDVAAMPTSSGAIPANPAPRQFDATCVAMLRAVGARPIGKTVTAEFAYAAPGATRNPWNLDHTPGGSSSGSAAAVAAGMVDMALGTQTGGSIIRPAAYNGVIGFKPSFGIVPRTGMMVLCDSLDTIGWFASTLELTRSVSRVFAPSSDDSMLPAIRQLKVAVLANNNVAMLDGEAFAVLRHAAEALQQQGADISWLNMDAKVSQLSDLHGDIMHYELARGLLPVMRSASMPLTLNPITLQAIDKGLALSSDVYIQCQQQRHAARQHWAQAFAAYDLIITPSAPGPAPKGLSSTGTSVFNRPWSLLGWPTIHLPCALSRNAMPLGLQCVGAPLRDDRLLGLAARIHPVIDQRNDSDIFARTEVRQSMPEDCGSRKTEKTH